MRKIFYAVAGLAVVALLTMGQQLAPPNFSTYNGSPGQVIVVGGPGASQGLWQYPWQKATNSVRLGQATVTLDATLDCVVINTNAAFQIGGIANMPAAGTSVKDLLVLVTNNSAANFNVTFTAAWHIDKPQGANQSSVWTITNTCYFIGRWNAQQGLYSNFFFTAAQ